MAHVAVTGGTGFIGSAVVRQLVAQGRSVRVLVEPGANTSNLEGLPVERVTADITSGKSMFQALSGCETLYHLAAVYKTWSPNRELLYRVNVEGTVATLLAAQHAKVRRVVYTSSVAAVGLAPDGVADEDTTWNLFDLANDYILTKWQSERLAMRFAEAGMSLVVVNPAFPFGPGDVAPTPTGKFLLGVLKGQYPLYLPGGICTIDVDDCAAGHLLAEEKGVSGERYILGNDNVTVKDFLQRAAQVAGVEAPRLPAPRTMGALYGLGLELWADHVSHREPDLTYQSVRYAMRNAFFSNAKAKRVLGLPSRPLEETLERSFTWFREHGYAK